MPNTCGRIASTPLGPVEYAESGDGPPLLSFHGTPGGFDGAILAAQMHCGDGFRIIGFSRPGYLRTPLSSGAGVPEQADLAAKLLDTLNIPAALVYGLSGGGPFALAFAMRHPSRCRALVLLAAVTAPDPRSTAQLELEIALFSLLDAGAWLAPLLARRWTLARILNVMLPFKARAAGYRNDAIVFGTFEPLAFEKILPATLIVHGTADMNASYPDAKRTAARLANCETLFVRRAGHAGVLFRPEVKRRISNFLAAHSNGTAG